jgi:hypothetical protein
MSNSRDFYIRQQILIDELVVEIVTCLHQKNAKSISFKKPIAIKTKNSCIEIIELDEDESVFWNGGVWYLRDLEITDLIAILTKVERGEYEITENLKTN